MAKEDKKEVEVKDDDILDQEDGSETESDEDDMDDSEDDDEDSKKEMKEAFLEIFKDVELSEKVKYKMATLFEAAISYKSLELSEAAEQYAEYVQGEYEDLAEAYVNEYVEEISESVTEYVDHLAESWVEENQVAIETGVRQELTEAFIEDMKVLFEKHNIELPEDKVDLYEEAQSDIEELKSKVAELTESVLGQRSTILEQSKKEVARELSEGMVDTQKDKFAQLLEDVDADSVESFKEKAQYIKESFFRDGKSIGEDKPKALTEEKDLSSSKKRYASFIAETNKKD